MSEAMQAEPTPAMQEAAAAWYARIGLCSPTAQERREFDDWLGHDPAHARAYGEYEQLWNTLGPLGANPRVAAERRSLLASTGAWSRRRELWRGAAIASAAVLSVLAISAVWIVLRGSSAQTPFSKWLAGPATFTTATGQYSTVPLEDGSTVLLNTESEIQPAYTRDERAVRLVRGQALFEVAKNPARPFVVYAGDRRIVALGTSFDVRLEESGVRVTLVEGRVAVGALGAAANTTPTELAPGQQLIAVHDATEVRSTDADAVTSWRHGRLIFSDEALADAVAEVNRYSRTKIVLADPALAELRVSGVFRTGQTAGFIAALETRFSIQIAERQAEHIVLARR